MVTISNIAEKLGVSPSTVSRVLNGNAEYLRPSFSKRAEKIRKTAAKLGYRPNAAAQSMKRGSHGCISLLTSPVPWLSNLSSEFLLPIQKNLAGLDYNMMLNVLPEDEVNAETELPRIFRENSVDGVLIAITHTIPEWLETLIRKIDVPKIWIGSKHDSDCIYHDDFGAAYGITKRLISEGHVKIAYQDFPVAEDRLQNCHFSVFDRMNGYLKAMKESGMEPYVARPEKELPPRERTAFATEKLIESYRPTAVISYDIPFTGEAFLCSAWKKGLRIPEDVCFVTFASSESYENDLNISSFIPNAELGITATKLLYEKIVGGNETVKPVILPFTFIEGDTVSGCTQIKKRGGK